MRFVGRMAAIYQTVVNKYRNRSGAHIWPVDHTGQNEAGVIFVAMLISCNYVT